MDETLDPEVESLKDWKVLLDQFRNGEGKEEVVSQTDWDHTFQTRRSAIVCGGINFRVLQWFQFHQDQWFVKYELEISGQEFHLKSGVMEIPWEVFHSPETGQQGLSGATRLGLLLGRVGRELISRAS